MQKFDFINGVDKCKLTTVQGGISGPFMSLKKLNVGSSFGRPTTDRAE